MQTFWLRFPRHFHCVFFSVNWICAKIEFNFKWFWLLLFSFLILMYPLYVYCFKTALTEEKYLIESSFSSDHTRKKGKWLTMPMFFSALSPHLTTANLYEARILCMYFTEWPCIGVRFFLSSFNVNTLATLIMMNTEHLKNEILCVSCIQNWVSSI